MTDLQRKRIFDALMGTIPQGVPLSEFKELEELVTEDLALIEPIIDEFLAEAAHAGQSKPSGGFSGHITLD